MIGTVLDKYEVLQKVGEGGMATVYRGRHTTLDREVAVKVLHPHLSSSTRNRKRFAREARAIEQLRHKNILEIFDYSGSSAEECYIVTEFVGGQTLTDLINTTGPLPSEVVSLVGISLTSALAYAHKNGVLHRDLKPDNVMLRHDGAVKLMDFGIARFLDESQVTMTGALVGSPAFMSPEQAKEGTLDQRSDLFSLGTVLFYLSTGHFPFHGSNPSLMLKNIIEGNRPHITDLQPGLSATLVDTIERLLQIDPNDRPHDASDVEGALRVSLDELGTSWTDPQWSVSSFIEEPLRYKEQLTEVLKTQLLSQGKRHMQSGEHLSCLRLFNRLLVIDEDNEEVLSLIKGLDTGTRPKPKFGLIAVAILSMATVIGGIIWYQNREIIAVPDARPPSSNLIKEGIQQESSAPPMSPVIAEGDRSDPAPSAPVPPKSTESVAIAPDTKQPPIRPVNQNVQKAVKAILPRRTIPPKVSDPVTLFGRVEIRVTNGWGYIHVDGVATGKTTRDPEPLTLPVGQHAIEIRSNNIEPYQIDVTVTENQILRFDDLVVSYLPFVVSIPEIYASNCEVNIDGIKKGTINSMGRTIRVPRRINSSSIVVLQCYDGVHTYTVNDSVAQMSTFPLPTTSP